MVINWHISNTEIARYQFVQGFFDAKGGIWEDSSWFCCFLFMLSVIFKH